MTVSKNYVAGDFQLLFDIRSRWTYQAETEGMLFYVSKKRFAYLLEDFPEVAASWMEQARKKRDLLVQMEHQVHADPPLMSMHS